MAYIDDEGVVALEATPRLRPGQQLRPTDLIPRLLTNDEGTITEVVLVEAGDDTGPIDLFGTDDPRLGTPGVETQRYHHQRTPTLVDLYVYENGKWNAPRIVGLVLYSAPSQATDTVVVVQAPGTATVNVPIQLSATASKPVANIKFFVGTQPAGSVDGNGPYGATYTPTAPGLYYVTAQATTASGQISNSLPRQLVVNATGTATNIKPTITLVITPSSIQLGQAATATANASDPDGPAPSVDFYDGDKALGSRPNAPYVQNLLPTTLGQHVISGTATDNQGATTTVDKILTVLPATSTVTPDAPLQNSNDTANTQDFDSPYGKNNIVVSIGGGAFAAYAGPYQVGNVARAPGYFQAKVKAATGRAESSITSSLEFTYLAPTPPAASAPDKPVIGTSIAGNGLVRVIWTAATTGAPASSFSIYRNGGGIPTATGVSTTTNSGGTTTYYYDDDSVTNGSPQTYRTAGVNAAGEGPKSDASAPVTPTAPVPPAPSAPTFNKQLTAAAPGNSADTLTFSALPGTVLRYNDPVQLSASAPGANTMQVFYPDLNTQIGQLDYDPLDEGHACGITLNGSTVLHYQQKAADGSLSALVFTNGIVLLA